MRDRADIEKDAQAETPTMASPALVHHVLKLGLTLEVLLDIRELLERISTKQSHLIEGVGLLRDIRDGKTAKGL